MPRIPVLPTYRCYACGYKWVPRMSVPVICPCCKSRRWNDPRARGTRVCKSPRKA